MKQILKQFEEQGFRIEEIGQGKFCKLMIDWSNKQVECIRENSVFRSTVDYGLKKESQVDVMVFDLHQNLQWFSPDEFRMWCRKFVEVEGLPNGRMLVDRMWSLVNRIQKEIPLTLAERTGRFRWLKLQEGAG